MNNTAQISIIYSLYAASLPPPTTPHIHTHPLSLHPLLEKTEMFIFVQPLSYTGLGSNTNQECVTHLRTESSDSMFSKVSLVTQSFFSPLHLPYHQTEQKSVPHHFGEIQVFAALLWSAGTFSKGDGECDWGVSSWHLWITEIVGAAVGATAGNGSLIFLDVERRDLSDSPQLDKKPARLLGDSARNINILSPKLGHF